MQDGILTCPSAASSAQHKEADAKEEERGGRERRRSPLESSTAPIPGVAEGEEEGGGVQSSVLQGEQSKSVCVCVCYSPTNKGFLRPIRIFGD